MCFALIGISSVFALASSSAEAPGGERDTMASHGHRTFPARHVHDCYISEIGHLVSLPLQHPCMLAPALRVPPSIVERRVVVRIGSRRAALDEIGERLAQLGEIGARLRLDLGTPALGQGVKALCERAKPGRIRQWWREQPQIRT